MNQKFSRRKFMRNSGVAGAGLLLSRKSAFAATGKAMTLKEYKEHGLKKELVVVTGDDPAKMVQAALDELGGIDKLVKRGDSVVVKPNIGWNRTPEQAANTNPLVVAAIVSLCLKAGAKEVLVFDRSCEDPRRTYVRSGIEKAATDAGGKTVYLRDSDPRYRDIEIPQGKILKIWPVHEYLSQANVLINVPVAKHHDLTRVTLGMKNIMGVCGGNRGDWHKEFIHERIADINTVMKTDLTVLDATRRLVRKGPQGGSLEDVSPDKKVIASVDRVAVDSYGASLWDGQKGADIGYIREANERGLGEMDLSKVTMKEITV